MDGPNGREGLGPSVRALLAELAVTEDELRRLPLACAAERERLLGVQERIVADLRSQTHPWPHAA